MNDNMDYTTSTIYISPQMKESAGYCILKTLCYAAVLYKP